MGFACSYQCCIPEASQTYPMKFGKAVAKLWMENTKGVKKERKQMAVATSTISIRKVVAALKAKAPMWNDTTVKGATDQIRKDL
eukprot:9024745-Pyramimonas_sp.AAC.1